MKKFLRPVNVLILLLSLNQLVSVAQDTTGYTSSGWDINTSSLGANTNNGEVIPVEFVVKLKGKADEDGNRITLEGKSQVENSRLTLYFKKKEREYQQSNRSSTSGFPTTTDLTSSSGDNSTVSYNGNTSINSTLWGNMSYMAGISSGHFKLLQLQPIAGTGKVTAQLYLGQNQDYPYLEAKEVSLNPFKKMPMDIVMSGFYQVDLRDVRVVVYLDGPVDEKLKNTEFTAEFRCYLQVGESYGGYTAGTGENAEVQWFGDSESSESAQ